MVRTSFTKFQAFHSNNLRRSTWHVQDAHYQSHLLPPEGFRNFKWRPKGSTFALKLNILRKAAASVLIVSHKALLIDWYHSLIGCLRVHLITSSSTQVAASRTWLYAKGHFHMGRRSSLNLSKAQKLCASDIEKAFLGQKIFINPLVLSTFHLLISGIRSFMSIHF